MPRIRPTTKLGIYGQYDLNPEKTVSLFTESKLHNKYFIKTPNWDVARLSFELKGIQSNREYEAVTREQSQMRARAHEQFRLNEKRLADADKLLQTLWEDFVEVNDFLKDCELKETESYDAAQHEKRKQDDHRAKIDQMNSDLAVLNEFVDKYERTINEYKAFEDVLSTTIQESDTFDTIEDLMQRCDSLLLAQVEISEVEQQKIQEIEQIRENLLETTNNALHLITGLDNDLSKLQERHVQAWQQCLRWEKSITVAKNYMADNEMQTNCMLDAIAHLYNLISKRRGGNGNSENGHGKCRRGDVEKQLDFIKEETGIMQEIHTIANRKLAKEDLSLMAEKGSIRTKPMIFSATAKKSKEFAGGDADVEQ